MKRHQHRGGGDRPARPAGGRLVHDHGGLQRVRRQHRRTRAAFFIHTSTASAERPSIDEIMAGTAPRARRRSPACASSCNRCRRIRIGGQLTKSLVPVHLAEPEHAGALSTPHNELEATPAQLLGAAGRHQRLADQESAGERRHRPRQGVDPRRDRRSRSRTRSYDAYGNRWISTIYAPNNQYKVILELEDQLPARSGGARRCST